MPALMRDNMMIIIMRMCICRLFVVIKCWLIEKCRRRDQVMLLLRVLCDLCRRRWVLFYCSHSFIWCCFL